jgi:hypothetical protein
MIATVIETGSISTDNGLSGATALGMLGCGRMM